MKKYEKELLWAKIFSGLYTIFIFLLWIGIGYIFNEVKAGFYAGIAFGMFYGIRILWAWIKDDV